MKERIVFNQRHEVKSGLPIETISPIEKKTIVYLKFNKQANSLVKSSADSAVSDLVQSLCSPSYTYLQAPFLLYHVVSLWICVESVLGTSRVWPGAGHMLL